MDNSSLSVLPDMFGDLSHAFEGDWHLPRLGTLVCHECPEA